EQQRPVAGWMVGGLAGFHRAGATELDQLAQRLGSALAGLGRRGWIRAARGHARLLDPGVQQRLEPLVLAEVFERELESSRELVAWAQGVGVGPRLDLAAWIAALRHPQQPRH